MESVNKCQACGKKMKLICQYEWTMKDEKAFQLGRKDAFRELFEDMNKKSLGTKGSIIAEYIRIYNFIKHECAEKRGKTK